MVPYVQLRVTGSDADPSAVPDLVVEIPHAAWRRAHYDAVRDELVGDLPARLQDFFFVNTDVGAEAIGLAVAQGVVEADPTRSALVLACRVPRTFMDCNRMVGTPEGDLSQGGITAGLAPFVRHPDDQALLRDLHRRYVAAATAAIDATCAAGGLALHPHSCAPRSVGIDHITDDIVSDLHRCWSPDQVQQWPLRPEIDLISTDAQGQRILDDALVDPLLADYRAMGLDAAESETYYLHPATQAARFAARHPGHTLCLELRRDLLVQDWRPFQQMVVDPAAVDRLAGPLIATLGGLLRARKPYSSGASTKVG